MGRITRPHGVRGEVAVHPLSEIEERYAPGSVLSVDDGRTLTVRSSRPHHGRLLVTFEEIADRTEAEALRGALLLVPASAVPPPPEDAFWVHQIVGLEVVTEEGRALGRVREVIAGPANDVWVTEEVLIPAVRDVVVSVDTGAGQVVIRDVPGLRPGT